jgi:hypothetical protein
MARSKKYNGNEIWSRSCPSCSSTITYTQKSQLNEAIKKNRKCRMCGCGWSKGLTKQTNESLKLNGERSSKTKKTKFANGILVQWNKGLTARDNDIVRLIAEKHRGFKHTEETKATIAKHSRQRWESGLYDDQRNPNQNAFRRYQNKVHRLTKKIQHLVDGYDKLKQGRMGKEDAYQIDHIIDIKWGFDNNIPAEIIAHISNLQFIPWQQNNKKAYYGKSKS